MYLYILINLILILTTARMCVSFNNNTKIISLILIETGFVKSKGKDGFLTRREIKTNKKGK